MGFVVGRFGFEVVVCIDIWFYLEMVVETINIAQGEKVFVPFISFILHDILLEFKRLQFRLKVCFAMTTNNSQGQALKIAGVDFRQDCFSQGQFYVACSRCKASQSLVILPPSSKIVRDIIYKKELITISNYNYNPLVNTYLKEYLSCDMSFCLFLKSTYSTQMTSRTTKHL